jgi:hypothetical protein
MLAAAADRITPITNALMLLMDASRTAPRMGQLMQLLAGQARWPAQALNVNPA